MDTKKILLIEDDTFLRELYVDLLKQNNYSVTAIEDGEGGLEEIKNGEWDLVLLDLTLPGLSGFEILENIEQENLKTNTKAIVILTNRDEDVETEKLKSTVDGYLIKSKLSPEDFIEKIKAFLK